VKLLPEEDMVQKRLAKTLYTVLTVMLGVLLLAGNAFAQSVTVNSFSSAEVNRKAQLSITYSTANGNTNLSAGTDSINVRYPNGFILPSTISTSNVTVNGTTASEVRVSGQYLHILTPVNVAKKGGTADVIISSAAGIINNRSTGTYSLSVNTSKDAGTVSGNITVNAATTTVSPAAVIPNTSVEFRTAKYTIGFSTGLSGRLVAGDYVTIDFPGSATIPNGALSGVSFNGSTTSATGSSASSSISVYVPVTVAGGGSITVEFSKGTGISNPPEGSFTLDVNTTVETTTVASDTFTISSAANLSFSAISTVDDTVNAQTKYIIDFVVSNTGALSPAANDQIVFNFSEYTGLPTSIATSNVTISNLTSGFSSNPSSVSVATNSISLSVPITINSSDEVRVTFESAAGIENQPAAGNYSLSATTYEDDGTTVIDATTSSNPFQIIASTDQVTTPTVTESGGTYTISFNAGTYGRLVGDTSKIHVDFPAATGYGALTGTVNGTSISSITESNDRVTVTIPSGVEDENNSSVTLVINGVVNPGAGNYNLDVSTSSEPAISPSSTYSIGGTSVTISNLSTGNNITNQTSTYSFDISGATRLEGKDEDYLVVQFPEQFTITSTTNVANFTTGGGTFDNVSTNVSDRSYTLQLTNNGNKFVPTSFSLNSALVTNAAVPNSDDYAIKVYTSRNTSIANSSAINLIGDASASPTVSSATANPSVASGNAAAYTVQFTTGATGKLKGGIYSGSDSVTVSFSNLSTVPASISAANVTMNGTTVSDVIVNASGAGGIVTVVMPSITINNSSSATLFFNKNAGILNTGPAGTGTVSLKTSTESSFSSGTNNFTLDPSSSLTVSNVSLSPNNENAKGSYTFSISPGTASELTTANEDSVVITFPDNTFVPGTISKSNVLVGGTNPSVNPTVRNNRTIAVPVPKTFAADSEFNLQISSNAGILNPSTSGSYTVDVYTTQETTPVTSPTYSVTESSSTINPSNVSLTDYSPGTAGGGTGTNTSYTIQFETGEFGRLIPGTSTIDIDFPAGSNLSSASGTINSTATTSSVTGTVITLDVSSAMSISNSSTVDVTISGVDNPDVGVYSLDVRTSIEDVYVSSPSFEITNAPPVTFNSTTLSDNTVNFEANYTLNVTTVSDLAAGSGTLTIKFPSSSSVQSSNNLTKTNYSLNGSVVDTVYSNIAENTITLVPSVLLSAGTFDVSITGSSELLNPSEPGDYTFTIRTSMQPAEATSPTITIAASGTSNISVPSVLVDEPVVGNPATWTWTFTTGQYGRLEPGVGKIFLEYNSSATFDNATINTNEITVDGSEPVAVSKNTSEIQITVPTNVSIGNNDQVTIVISDAAGIVRIGSTAKTTYQAKAAPETTPTIQADQYTAYTSAEPNASTSNSVLPVELLSFTVSANANDQPALVWSTGTEKENYGFHIQRTDNNSDQFSTIGFVEGVGFSTEKQTYRYTDESVNTAGEYTYRIIQEDFDGTLTEIAKQTFTFEKPNQTEVFANYPNPFNPTTTIRYDLANAGKVQAFVYNIIGQKVATLVDTRQEPGKYTVLFNANRLSSGVYFLYFQTEGLTKTQKMLLVK
jgi:hypothetical protein